MRVLVVARHAESRLNLENVLNGDPAVRVELTERGREQARELGEAVGQVDLVAHSTFGRTGETAELAWPDAPNLVVPELNEIRFGRWEGTPFDDGYGAWVQTSGPEEECPGGGESRLAAAKRYIRGYRILLERPEDRIALVAHGAQVRYLLLAVWGEAPTPLLELVPLAQPFTIQRDELERAISVLEDWAAAPAF